MDRITIFERDISNIPAEDIGTNIVYVPGYAVMGPVNTPTLCRNLNEFQSIFGITPYLFENGQSFESIKGFKDQTTGNFANAGDREKSYIYAVELLNKGLPVLFERVMVEDKKEYFVFETKLEDKNNNSNYLTIKIKNPGLYGNSISYTLTKVGAYNYKIVLTQNNEYTDSTEYKDKNNNNLIGQKRKYLERPITLSPIEFSLNYNDTLYFENLHNLPLIEFGNITGEITELKTVDEGKFININPEFSSEQTYEIGTVVYYNGVWKCHTAVETAGTWAGETNWTKICEFEIKDIYTLMSGNFEQNSETYDIISEVYDENTETYNEKSLFTKLADRGEYEIKFITSGAYPILDFYSYSYVDTSTSPATEIFVYKNFIFKALLWTAARRGDAIAITDYLNEYIGNTYQTIMGLEEHLNEILNPKSWLSTKEGTYIVKLSNNRQELTTKYGCMFTPWYIDKSIVLNNQNIMPPSFGYLKALATSVKTNPNWYPVAGVTRGIIPNLQQLCTPITNAIAESLQSTEGVSINPITLIKPYGFTIWGNRTLNYNEDVLIASSLLHIRNLVCDVKKAVYVAAKKFMFEPISEILWLNFKSEIEPLLDKMKSGNGLTKYEILRKSTTEKATICAVIRLWAVDAVEKFDVTIELSDSYVNIE